MSTDDEAYEILQNIFLAAVKREAGEAREAYLNEACGGDARLRESLEALLKEYEEGGESVGSIGSGGTSGSTVADVRGNRAASMFVPGKVLADRYRIVTLLLPPSSRGSARPMNPP